MVYSSSISMLKSDASANQMAKKSFCLMLKSNGHLNYMCMLARPVTTNRFYLMS